MVETHKVKVNKQYVKLQVHNAVWHKDQCIIKYNDDHLGKQVTYEELKKILDKYEVVDRLWYDNYYRMYWVELLDEDLKKN